MDGNNAKEIQLIISSIKNRNFGKAKEIIEEFDIDVNTKFRTLPFLSYAIGTGDVEILKYLIDKGSDIHYLDEYRQSFLHHAIKESDAFKYLIRKGVDVNIKNCKGENILDIVLKGHNMNLYPGQKMTYRPLKDYEKKDLIVLILEFKPEINTKYLPNLHLIQECNRDSITDIFVKNINIKALRKAYHKLDDKIQKVDSLEKLDQEATKVSDEIQSFCSAFYTDLDNSNISSKDKLKNLDLLYSLYKDYKKETIELGVQSPRTAEEENLLVTDKEVASSISKGINALQKNLVQEIEYNLTKTNQFLKECIMPTLPKLLLDYLLLEEINSLISLVSKKETCTQTIQNYHVERNVSSDIEILDYDIDLTTVVIAGEEINNSSTI